MTPVFEYNKVCLFNYVLYFLAAMQASTGIINILKWANYDTNASKVKSASFDDPLYEKHVGYFESISELMRK